MIHNEPSQPVLAQTIQYKYIIKCKDREVQLEVDDRDVLRNADDEIDCPLDVVLRKNDYSFNDLMSWDAREIQFVKLVNKDVHLINSVELNVNL